MNEILQPWQLLLAILSGWIHHRQQKMIEFQNDQIESLLKQMGRKRILLTDDQRRLLAVKGKALGRKALRELTTIVTPDTILRWHRKLVANKWDHSEKRKSVGRPRIRQVIVDLILRFAKQNSTWGYDRIQGALASVGYHISDSTVGNILKANGIEPAPDRQRQTTWARFSKRTETCWRRSISPRSRSGPRAGWSRSTCCSSWNSRRAAFISQAALPIRRKRG